MPGPFRCFQPYKRKPFPSEAAGSCLGELGPVDFSTIALLHGRDPLYEKAVSLFIATEYQCVFIVLNCMNDALTHQRYCQTEIKTLSYFTMEARTL